MKIKVRSTSLPLNCLFKRKLEMSQLFQVTASIRSFWQLFIFLYSSLSACNCEQPGCLVICVARVLSVDIWVTSEDVNNKLNYLSAVNLWCSERIRNYISVMKQWNCGFCFSCAVIVRIKDLRITVVWNNWMIIWPCSGCPADGTRVAASAFALCELSNLRRLLVGAGSGTLLDSRRDPWGTAFRDCLPSKHFGG